MGTPKRTEAKDSIVTLASAAAWRNWPPPRLIVWLPNVGAWSTVLAVAPWIQAIFSKGKSSSSAVVWLSAVDTPLPSPTLAVHHVTFPSCRTVSQESSWFGVSGPPEVRNAGAL